MTSRGDKYVIEIADVAYITQDDGLKRQIYRIKGFNTLILDDYALSKLTELEGAVVNADEAFKRGYDEGYKEAAETIRLDKQNEEEEYERGLSDAWETAKRLSNVLPTKLSDLFGIGFLPAVMKKYSASEIKRILDLNEAQDEAIEVGDEVTITDEDYVGIEDDWIGVVTCIESDGYRIMFRSGNSDFFGDHYTFKKTGRHFPIQDLLDEMKSEWHTVEDDGEPEGCVRCIHVDKTDYEFPCADYCHNGNDGGRSYFERSE